MSKATETDLRKRLADAEAKLHAQAQEKARFDSEADAIMDVMTEVLRGMRQGHVAYTQALAKAYYESHTGRPWDEPIRPVAVR